MPGKHKKLSRRAVLFRGCGRFDVFELSEGGFKIGLQSFYFLVLLLRVLLLLVLLTLLLHASYAPLLLLLTRLLHASYTPLTRLLRASAAACAAGYCWRCCSR